ncbi:hypothetical protein Aperf_G00000004156 [Anoplocephala perfoliata]
MPNARDVGTGSCLWNGTNYNFDICSAELRILSDSNRSKKEFKILDIAGIRREDDQYKITWPNEDTITVDKGSMGFLEKGLSKAWKYFPAFDFRTEITDIEVLDIGKSVNFEEDTRTWINQCISYLDTCSKRIDREKDKDGLIRKICHMEDKYLYYSDINEKVLSYAVAPLLSFPFHTALDLSNTKLDRDFVHLCGIGLKTDRCLRALILKDVKSDGDSLRFLLGCFPITSKVRKLVIGAGKDFRDTNAFKAIGSLNSDIFERLVDLSLSGECGEDSPFLKCFGNRNLDLRSLRLNRVHPEALKKVLKFTPKLRSLTVEDSNLEIAAVSKCILDAKLAKLEVLVLPDSKMDDHDPVIEECFASLCRLKILNLTGCSGKQGGKVLKSLFNGLGSVKRHVSDQLDLSINYQDLEEGIRKKVGHLKSLSITVNESCKSLKSFLLRFPNLESLTVGGDSESNQYTLDILSDVFIKDDCRVKKLTLGKISSTSNLHNFLSKLVKSGKFLNYLDIRGNVFNDEQLEPVLKLIKNANPNEAFGVFFKYFSLRKQSGYTGQIDGLVRRKWPSLKICFPYRLYVAKSAQAVIDMQFSALKVDDSEKLGRLEGPRRLFELEKFKDAIINPSPELNKISLELTSTAMKAYRKMPNENLEQLGRLYPKVLQAKIAQDECRSLYSLEAELVEAALDPQECTQCVSKVMTDVKKALETSLKSVCEECSQKMKDITYKESIQSFTSLLDFAFTPTEETEEIISKSLNQQVEESFRSMIMDLRIKVAEQMLTSIMRSLKQEFESCLKGFPSREELEPAQGNSTYLEDLLKDFLGMGPETARAKGILDEDDKASVTKEHPASVKFCLLAASKLFKYKNELPSSYSQTISYRPSRRPQLPPLPPRVSFYERQVSAPAAQSPTYSQASSNYTPVGPQTPSIAGTSIYENQSSGNYPTGSPPPPYTRFRLEGSSGSQTPVDAPPQFGGRIKQNLSTDFGAAGGMNDTPKKEKSDDLPRNLPLIRGRENAEPPALPLPSSYSQAISYRPSRRPQLPPLPPRVSFYERQVSAPAGAGPEWMGPELSLKNPREPGQQIPTKGKEQTSRLPLK